MSAAITGAGHDARGRPDAPREILSGPLSDSLSGPRSTGWWGMVWFAATEATLFACFIASYFFLLGDQENFGADGGQPISLIRPLIMTLLLLTSSATMWWGESGIKRGEVGRLRIGLAVTFALGTIFLLLQAGEYASSPIGPGTNAYGSLFFTITGFHGAHVALGLLMNLFVQLRARLGHFTATRHDAVTNISLYWHVVDGVWIAIFASLYLSPRLW